MATQPNPQPQSLSVSAFCAFCQEDTPHQVGVHAHNKEVVLTCPVCQRFIKFGEGTSTAQMKEYLARHREHNVGQVLTEKHEAEIQALIDSVARDLA